MPSYKFLFSCVALLFVAIPRSLGQSNDPSNPFPMPPCNGYVIEEASMDTIQGYMSEGNLTSVQLTKCLLQRISQLNPYLGAVLEINPDALDIAEASDLERQQGIVRGPLHGIPFLVKDNIGSKDKMQTTAGSMALIGSVIPRDSTVVALLRKAGAVLLGKANLSEWADARSSDYSEGFSARGGQVRPAYNLSQEPGGSSSGPAVAVAVNMVPFALGTETDGSVISPADRNSVVGFKGTVGLTSRAGVIPESHRQDTVGTFGKTVKDAVYALDGCFGPDPLDSYSLEQIGKTPNSSSPSCWANVDYSQFVKDKSALMGVKLGIPWERLWTAPSTQNQLPQLFAAIDKLRAAGAIIYNNTNGPYVNDTISPDGWSSSYGANFNMTEAYLGNVDLYNDLNAYLANLTFSPVSTLDDIIEFNDANTGSEGGIPNTHPAFPSGQDGFLASQATLGIMNETYQAALEYVQYTSGPMGIDAILNPTINGTTIALDGYLVPSDDSAPGFQLAARIGYPIISIPVGIDVYGMPFGICVGGTAWSESKLIELASGMEDAIQGRALPKYYEKNAKNVPVPYGYQPGEPLPVSADYTRLW